MKTKIKALLTIFILIIMILSTKAFAANNSIEGWYETQDYYNMRPEGEENGKVIARIPPDTVIHVIRTDKKISNRVIAEYNGKKGSILKAGLIKTSAPSSTTTSENSNKKEDTKKEYYKNKYPLLMRKEGEISGKTIITIPINSTIEVIGEDSKVSKRVIVTYKNKTGSVLNCGLVKITSKNSNTTYTEEYKYYARTNSKCDLYNSKGKVIKTLEKNELIKVISFPSNNKKQAKVEWYGTTGYIIKNNISKTDNAIFVSINKQKETLIRDGILVTETSVVTGMKEKTDTPKGAYSIKNKRKSTKDDPVYLIGPNYKSQVDYWMQIYNGYGIHDANRWRKKYGGNIYKTNGSHGCVNTPLKAMKIIYENSYKKMPVYIQ